MYTLQVNFTPNQLDNIYAQNKKVVLVKENAQRVILAWLAFNPVEENIITWETNFSVYASKTAIQNGAQLKLTALQEAIKGYLYRFEHGHFKQEGGAEPYSYSIYHAAQDFRTTTFGLAQKAFINGTETSSPVSAITADYNDQITLTPIEKVRIFLQSSINNGTVIPSVSGESKLFDFTQTRSLAAKYDSENNIFLNDTF